MKEGYVIHFSMMQPKLKGKDESQTRNFGG